MTVSSNVPEWRTLIKSGQQSRVEGQINDIKKNIDPSGKNDKKGLEVCYGKFTADLMTQLKERDDFIKNSLSKKNIKAECLPVAPFNCSTQTINDFDIREHKDFNKYLEAATQCAPSAPVISALNNSHYLQLKKELESSQATLLKLQDLKAQVERDRKSPLIEADLKDKAMAPIEKHPSYPDLMRRLKSDQLKCWGCKIVKN